MKKERKMKKVLFPILALVLALSLALPMAAVAGAQVEYIETLYLSNTLGASDGQTQLYEVVLDDDTTQADLIPLPDVGYGVGIIPLEHADAIACTPDGTKIYAIDDQNASTGPREIGVYDLTGPSWISLGNLKMPDGTTNFRTTDQLAFAQDGTLYVTRNEDEKLYTIDIDSVSLTYLQVSEVGQVQVGGNAVNINGADIVFDADDWCWLFTAGSGGGNAAGLYKFSQSAGPTTASLVGANSQTFTGMAIRGGGAGDLVGSRTDNDSIAVISKTNGSTGTNYPMYLGGSRYNGYVYGDMTVGELEVEVGEPSITLTKSAEFPGDRAGLGETIDYTFAVYNDGDVDLTDVEVDDDMFDPNPVYSYGDYDDDVLSPGETAYFIGSYVVDEDDIASCMLENTATATALYGTEEVTDEASALVPVAKTVNLWAGKYTDVGEVEIWNDGTILHVTYSTDDPWVLTETHLYVGSNEPPCNTPGQFPYDLGDALSFNDTEVIFEIPLAKIDSYSMQTNNKGKLTGKMIADGHPGFIDVEEELEPISPGDPIYVAAHSVVEKVDPFSECLVSGAASDEVLLLVEGAPGSPVGYTALYQTYTGVPAPSVLAWTHSAWVPYGIAGAEWISSSYNAEDPDNNTWRLFTRSFDLPASATNISGAMTVNCDNAEEVYLNDVFVGNGSPAVVYGASPPIGPGHGYDSVEGPWDVSPQLQAGTNNLWTMTRNYGWPGGVEANPTALIYKLCYSYDIVTTETAWGGWGDALDNIRFFEDSNWSNYIEYFVMTCPPTPNDG